MSALGWTLVAVYAVGWLACCRIAYQSEEFRREPWAPVVILGGSLLWPLYLLVCAITCKARAK